MIFVSLWAGDLETARSLPSHLESLYDSLGSSSYEQDPEICAERELVPIEEILEPLSHSESFLSDAVRNAKQKSLRVAAVAVGIYTKSVPQDELLQPPNCGLKFIGTFKAG
jgi:hypothetical protein